MATHDANIDNLRNATLGEQVRGSMIQLFEEDYNLVKRGITVGTDVTSASSSTTGYYDGNVYINSSTLDVWKIINEVWTLQGNLKGISAINTSETSADSGTNTVTFVLTDGTTKEFNIKNGSKGSTGVSITGVIDNGDGTFKLTMSNGTVTGDVATIKGDKGDKGDKGNKGDTGEKGRSVDTLTMSGTGKSHPITATYSDGTSQLIGVINDGNDGTGAGDMTKATYDKNDNGIVDMAEALSDGTNTMPYSAVANKADKATTLGGYGITDAYTKSATDGLLTAKINEPTNEGSNNQVLMTDGDGGRSWGTITSVANATNATNASNLKTATGTIISTDTLISNYEGEIGDAWSGATSYTVGQYCIYNNVLWKCKANNTNQTPAEGTYWTACKISNEVSTLNSKIVQIKSKQYDTTTNASGNLSISGYTKVVAIELDSSMTNTTCILANSGTGNPIIRFKNSDSGASLVSTPVKFTMYYI